MLPAPDLARPTTSDLRFAQILEQLAEVKAGIAELTRAMQAQAIATAESRTDRADIRKEVDRLSSALWGVDEDGGLMRTVTRLAGQVNRLLWMVGIVGGLGTAVGAPLIVGLIGFVAWLFWLLLTNKMIVP